MFLPPRTLIWIYLYSLILAENVFYIIVIKAKQSSIAFSVGSGILTSDSGANTQF